MTRFSSSFELDANTKVKPFMIVSIVPLGVMVETLLTLYILGGAWACRITNVKLNVSSSSLVKRMRKDGGPPEEADSGSYNNQMRHYQPSKAHT